MLLSMILLTPFTVTTLNVLQSFFLTLRTRKVLQFSIIEVFPVICVRIKRVLIINHLIREVSIDSIDLLPFEWNTLSPPPLKLSMPIKNILLLRTGLFLTKIIDKFIQKLRFNSQNLSLQLIPKLPFLTRKYSRIILETHLRKQVILPIKIITLTLKIKFTIAISKTWKLSRRSLKANLLTVLENHMIPSHVNTIRWIQMNIDRRLQISINLITTTQKQNRWNRRMMTYLLSIKRTTSNKTLKCLTKNRIERLLHVEKQQRMSQPKNHSEFHSLLHILTTSSPLEILWTTTTRKSISWKLRITVENCNRQRYI